MSCLSNKSRKEGDCRLFVAPPSGTRYTIVHKKRDKESVHFRTLLRSIVAKFLTAKRSKLEDTKNAIMKS